MYIFVIISCEYLYFPDINECEDKTNFPCYGFCTNTPGSYNCTCLHGYEGTDGKSADGCRHVAKDSKFSEVVISLGIYTFT